MLNPENFQTLPKSQLFTLLNKGMHNVYYKRAVTALCKQAWVNVGHYETTEMSAKSKGHHGTSRAQMCIYSSKHMKLTFLPLVLERD